MNESIMVQSLLTAFLSFSHFPYLCHQFLFLRSSWFSERRRSSWETTRINSSRENQTYGLKEKLGGESRRKPHCVVVGWACGKFWANFHFYIILVQRPQHQRKQQLWGEGAAFRAGHTRSQGGIIDSVELGVSLWWMEISAKREHEKPRSFQTPVGWHEIICHVIARDSL